MLDDDATERFEQQLQWLEAALGDQRDVAVARLRALHEARARALLGIGAQGELVARVRALVERGVEPGLARDAIARLEDAERYQWEIGTWSTGSGEGLSSMFEVRTLQLARGWLCAARVEVDPDATATARRCARDVDEDPNDIAASLRAHVVALRDRLGS